MESCVFCSKTNEEVRIFDGIYISEPVKTCERCALINGLPLLKRPSAEQLKDSEKPYAVHSRLARMAHLAPEARKEKSAAEELKQLEENPLLQKPNEREDMVFKLVDNFHWVIQTERRRKGYSAKQLAEALGQSESAIIMLEKGIVPSKSLDLIRAIEQLLKVRLIKRDLIERHEEQKRKEEQLPKTIAMPAELNEKNKDLSRRGEIAENFKRSKSEDVRIRDLQKLNERIEADMEYFRKSKEDVGKEQLEGFGKEDTEYIKKSVFRNAKPKNSVPTIHELMKKREASIAGRDIEIVEENSDKISKSKWEDLE